MTNVNMIPTPAATGRFRCILFCTDFSSSADAAFEFALDVAVRHPGASLHLLHVIHEPDAQFWTSYLSEVENLEADARNAVDDKITTAYRSRLPAGVELTVTVLTGPAATTILEHARTTGADLIVVGRHGHGRVGSALFGSVAEKVVRKAGCPVLVVPRPGPARPPQ